MSNSMFQQAWGGMPNMGLAGLSDGVADQNQWAYDRAWTAIRAAQARNDVFGVAGSPAWSELANLINAVAAVDSGRFTLAGAAPELLQRTASINAYLTAASNGNTGGAGPVATSDLPPVMVATPVVPITQVSLPLDPNIGTVAVRLPDGTVVTGSGQVNANGTVTVAGPNGAITSPASQVTQIGPAPASNGGGFNLPGGNITLPIIGSVPILLVAGAAALLFLGNSK